MIFFLATLLLAPPAEAEFTVHTVTGRPLSGPMRKLTADGSLRLGGDQAILVPGEELIGIRRRGALLPPQPLQNALFLSNGDCLPLDPKGLLQLQDDQLQCVPAAPLRLEKGLELSLPFPTLALLWIATPAGIDEPERLRRRLLLETRKRDVLLLRSGDRVEGSLSTLDWRKGCTVKTAEGRVNVPWPQLAVLAFNTEFQSKRQPKKVYSRVVLGNGGRLSFSAVELVPGQENVLVARTLSGTGLRFPLEELVSLDLCQHRAVYLSDLKPRSYEHTPYLGLSWPLETDAAVSGRALRLAGHTFDKGLGMHAKSRVTYTLDCKYLCFEALAGLDADTGKRGRVKIEVLVDGKSQPLGLDRDMSGKDAPLPVRIDVRKARELTLVVDFGSSGDVQGHLNWCDARLIK